MFKTKNVLSGFLASMLVFSQINVISVSAATLLESSSLTSTTNLNTAVNSASNSYSSFGDKQQGPTVDVVFSPTAGIKAGEKIIASATPNYFKEDSSKLYFTWYLKRKNCDKTNNVTDGNRNCDLDGNDKIDENDWKIAAAKIIIDGSYDNSDTNYASFTNGINEETSGYRANPSPTSDKNDKNNNNVWAINSGADHNDPDSTNCYVQDPKAGLIYELRRVNEKLADCPSGYHKACAQDNQSATCDILNPLYDPQAVAIDHNYAIAKTIKATTQKFCAAVSNDISKPFCKIGSESNLKNFTAYAECNNGGVTMCVRDSNMLFPSNSSSSNPASAAIFSQGNLCSSLTLNPNNPAEPSWVSGSGYNFLQDKSAPTSYTNPDATYTNVVGQSCSKEKAALIASDSSNAGLNLDQNCSFVKSDNLCKHLFPKVPGDVTGDGKFTLAEKKFWGANPGSAATAGASVDEAMITGLGMNKFSWTYSDGDQVGLVVEGESMLPTLHQDSSYMRMWAFSKNTCSALSDIGNSDLANGNDSNKNKRGFYLEKDGTSNCDLSDKTKCVGILTAETDLNDCLEENLIDPTNSNSDQDLDVIMGTHVNLGYSPQNPINDSSGNGDVLNVTADPSNFDNSNAITYSWSILLSQDGSNAPNDSTVWKNITTLMKNNHSFSADDLVGFGKNKLTALLNLSDSDIDNKSSFYLKARVVAKGTGSDSGKNIIGETDAIRVVQQKSSMRAYDVSATGAGVISITPNEMCFNSTTNKAISPCYVIKNQIMGMVVNNITKNSLSWTVNGNPMACNSSISSDCNNGNSLIFPILGNIGEAINVEAKGLNDKGEAIDVTRSFVISDSQLAIYSADNNAWPKTLGYYRGQGASGSCAQGDPNCVADLSSDILETSTGNTITLDAIGQSGFNWIVDGQELTSDQDNPQISFVAEKPIGESYNISLSTHLTPNYIAQLNNLRYALNKNWGVVADNGLDENQSASLQINVINDASSSTVQNNPASLGASLITHVSQQLMFLFKLSLASLMLFLVTGLMFALMPEKLFRED